MMSVFIREKIRSDCCFGHARFGDVCADGQRLPRAHGLGVAREFEKVLQLLEPPLKRVVSNKGWNRVLLVSRWCGATVQI